MKRVLSTRRRLEDAQLNVAVGVALEVRLGLRPWPSVWRLKSRRRTLLAEKLSLIHISEPTRLALI
eukprot:8852993-Alexandrium_andersonii.AAC.1